MTILNLKIVAIGQLTKQTLLNMMEGATLVLYLPAFTPHGDYKPTGVGASFMQFDLTPQDFERHHIQLVAKGTPKAVIDEMNIPASAGQKRFFYIPIGFYNGDLNDQEVANLGTQKQAHLPDRCQIIHTIDQPFSLNIYAIPGKEISAYIAPEPYFRQIKGYDTASQTLNGKPCVPISGGAANGIKALRDHCLHAVLTQDKQALTNRLNTFGADDLSTVAVIGDGYFNGGQFAIDDADTLVCEEGVHQNNHKVYGFIAE